MMPAGAYYVGDLCYVIRGRHWTAICGRCPWDDEFTLKGAPLAIYGTAHGDGAYDDQEGRRYSVDSGTIGCVPTSAQVVNQKCLTETVKGGHGHIVMFEQGFETSSYSGVIQIGHIRINTDPDWTDMGEAA